MERATDKQCYYLNRLERKVLGIQATHPNLLAVSINNYDWFEERERGMTKEDADVRIKAYRQILRAAKAKMILLGLKK